MRLILIIITLLKLLTIFAMVNYLPDIELGGASDADYYHDYALGFVGEEPTSIWPEILRYMNSYGWYKREAIAAGMAVVNTLAYPVVIYKLCKKFGSNTNAAILVTTWFQIMPSNYLICLDIYRDNVILGLALLAVYLATSKIVTNHRVYAFIAYAALSIFGFQVRPYLGASIFAAFVLSLALGKKCVRWVAIIPCLLVLLLILNEFNALDPLFEYRGEFGFELGESSFGIGLLGKGMLETIGLICLSAFYQLLGLYIYNFKSFIVFLTESAPFFLLLCYSIKYVKLDTIFLKYTFLFFVIYSTVWIIGNDNLGTGVRLRLVSYTLMLPIFSIALSNKFCRKIHG